MSNKHSRGEPSSSNSPNAPNVISGGNGKGNDGETITANTTNSSHGAASIADLLSSAEEPEQSAHSEQPVKRPRHFIATVACENCRLKKTRCDESRPRCGLCKSLGLECVYSERRTSRRDQSLGLIISTLHRIETKLEYLPQNIANDLRPLTEQLTQVAEVSRSPEATVVRASSSHAPPSQYTSPAETRPSEPVSGVWDAAVGVSRGQKEISFSQHAVPLWPGARAHLPERLLAAYDQLGKNYVIDLETARPPLPMWLRPYPMQLAEGVDWLEALPFAVVKGLAEAFFSLFNTFSPFLDRKFFFAFTLGSVIENGFAYTIESCLVLNVMALGCLAVRAYQEGDFPLPGSFGDSFEAPPWIEVTEEEPPGLRFFNEARKRIGFLICQNDLQCCQFYLLSAMYYAYIIRPMDSWAMLNRAAACCLSMLTNRDVNFDEWEGDMKSRAFWNTVMHETILVQELDLPSSGLARFEDYVPIPKFIDFSPAGLPANITSMSDPNEAYFQYHFLAQVAHRIILTRIRHSLYVFSESEAVPRPAVSAELHHQIEQWRLNLPAPIQFSNPDHDTSPSPVSPRTRPSTAREPSPSAMEPTTAPSPAAAVADSLLRARFRIAKFHMGRPYIYKALAVPPNRLTDDDLEQVRSGLRYAMDWPVIQGVFRRMKSCIPIKFAFCSQFFGQILIFYCIAHSPDPRLRSTLPADWKRWYGEMLAFIEHCAAFSPAVARDLELLRLLPMP